MSNSGRSSIDEQALRWFVRLRDEPVSESERAAFSEWRLKHCAHAEAYEEISNLWSELSSAGASREPAARPAAARIRRRKRGIGRGEAPSTHKSDKNVAKP
jgi:ferric-dicitrate binding protein FerR (iron transport regulator)